MWAAGTPGWWRWAGLAAGPGLWAVGTQVKYAVVNGACPSSGWMITLGVSVLTALAAVWAAFLSRRAWQVAGAKGDANGAFLAGLSALTGLLFAMAMLMQGGAGLVFTACEP